MKKCLLTIAAVLTVCSFAQAQMPDLPGMKEIKGKNLINCVFDEMAPSTLVLDPSVENTRLIIALEGVDTGSTPVLGMEMETLGEVGRARCPDTYDIIGKLENPEETIYIQLRTKGCASGEITATATGLEPRMDNPQRYEDFDEIDIIESVKCEKVDL